MGYGMTPASLHLICIDAPQRGPVLLMLFEDGPLYDVFKYGRSLPDPYYFHFEAILWERGYGFVTEDDLRVSIYPLDDKSKDDFLTIYRWQWIQQLASQRLFDVHTEVFEYFAQHPDHLKKLEWRRYEELLDSIFRNQGFHTELGPGTNDGGVDIRLYQSQAIPQLVTVVQAKRYTKRPIGLDAVAALFGIAVQQKASRGILATTSRFQPKARWFAASVEGELTFPSIELVDSARIGGWCAEIAEQLNVFFYNGTMPYPPIIDATPCTPLTGKIVVAHHCCPAKVFSRPITNTNSVG
jgi:hypothetical protein